MKTKCFFTGLVLLMLGVSCTDEKLDSDVVSNNPEDTTESFVCDGLFNVVVNGYDGIITNGTRGGDGWNEGDMIYLLFSSGSNLITAEALYSESKWTVSLTGKPVVGVQSLCKAYYFENAGTKKGMIMNLSDRTAIYEDVNGTYLFDGSMITISASLKPKLGRIRFAGTKNTIINVFGCTCPSSFDASSGTFSYSSSYVTDTVNTSGYTPYLYGFMNDTDDPRLYVTTKTSAFTKYCDEKVLKTGESGWLTIPSTESHFGWYEYLALKINGYELKMMPIWYATASTPYMFLLSETEVTEGLYNAVVGSGSKTSQNPKVNITYNDAYSFAVNSMSSLAGVKFSLPTEAEWKYAFGKYSYSGSDVIGEVAWYSGNSDEMKHAVRQLKPNEYGLYDMSGNVSEFTYSSSSYCNYYGGNYLSAASECKSNVRENVYSGYGFEMVGFRLQLKF